MVEKSFKDTGEPPLGVESSNDPEWALIDLGNVIVHIMTEKARAYYSIEKLWAVKDGTESNPVEKDVAQS
jgi:ribosome-associated protein